MPKSSNRADPQSPTWAGFNWSDWHDVTTAVAPRESAMPTDAGVYQIRAKGKLGLIYIGQTGRSLRGRVRRLRLALGRAARGLDAVGHVAGACVYEHQRHGATIQVSWVAMPNLDKRERLGREVDLIAAYRQVMHESPSCQFAWIPGD